MKRNVVAASQGDARERLHLAPRLRFDETISSWMERFAGAYGMTLREFSHWLGYRNMYSVQGRLSVDLDVNPPGDLPSILSALAGLSEEIIRSRQLSALDVLPARLRRAFCPQCWSEEGPYRRRDWASAWALVCTHHQQLLVDKPTPSPPFKRDHEDSWPEFYGTPRLWRESGPVGERPRWDRLCRALGVDARTEFLWAWPWLRNLQQLARSTADEVAAARSSAGGAEFLNTAISKEWLVKRDLLLYLLLRFHERSALRTLDPTICWSRLIPDRGDGEICTLTTPAADYDLRLFAAVVARHLWERLTRGHWCCRQHHVLEEFLHQQKRWNNEDWWLETRLRTWPPSLELAGRELFNKEDRWAALPPWQLCREFCVRSARGLLSCGWGVLLPADWRCEMTEDCPSS